MVILDEGRKFNTIFSDFSIQLPKVTMERFSHLGANNNIHIVQAAEKYFETLRRQLKAKYKDTIICLDHPRYIAKTAKNNYVSINLTWFFPNLDFDTQTMNYKSEELLQMCLDMKSDIIQYVTASE